MRLSQALGAAACALALYGCEERAPQIDLESSIPVRVAPVVRGPIAEYASATGTVQALEEAVLKCEQGGRYQLQTNPRTAAPYAMGDAVKSGEVLARLVNEEFVNQVAIEAKELQFTQAQREYEKQQGLFDLGGVTMRELTEAERLFIDARYAYENAQLSLAKLEVASPLGGTIVNLPHYSRGQRLEPGAVLATVMDTRRLYTDVSLPGTELPRVAPQQPVLVSHYGGAEADTLPGTVVQVAPVLDPDSRMFTARIHVNNDSLALRPGMFVKIDIVVVQRDSALMVPKDVIIDNGEKKTVFVVDRGLAVERDLEIGLSNRAQAEVLSGLDQGERLVVEGYETLRNHSKVKVEE